MTVIDTVLAHPGLSALGALAGLALVVGTDLRARRRPPKPATRAHKLPEPPEFDELLGPVIPDCENPLGCECHRKGMRTHAERAGCVFRGGL